MTQPPFFITGLPRSRTAWMASLVTGHECFCHHDLWHRCGGTFDLFCEALWKTPVCWVGASDPILALHADTLIERFPHSRWLIVERSREAVERSCEKLGWPLRMLGMWQEKLAELTTRTRVHHLNLDTATDEQILDSLQHVAPAFWSYKHTMLRIAQMRDLNVQVHDLPAKVAAAMRPQEDAA